MVGQGDPLRCLLPRCFPQPEVSDLIECNKIIDEAIQQSKLGIRVMPIDWKDLRVSVVTDAAWGNLTYEISFGSRTPRKIFGAAQAGPDLPQILGLKANRSSGPGRDQNQGLKE